MNRLARTAGRLADGSTVTARRLGARLAAWVARGRRHDLTGWKASLGCWLRLAALVFGLYLLWRLVRAVPALMWPITGAWTLASWRADRPATEAAEEPDEAPPRASSAEVLEATLEWIRQQIGDRQGVHLRDLLTHAQAHGMFEGMDVAEFRTHLERWDIPVRDRQRVRGLGVTVGIRQADLKDFTSPSPEPAAEEAA